MLTGQRWIQGLKPILAVLLGLALGLAVTFAAGEDPWHILQILLKSAFGSRYDLGMTLFYSTPLIFTGLSVTLAFQTGMFNIGAEGQLLCGTLAVAALGICVPNVPSPIAPVLAILVAFGAGAAWGAIPGWLRAKRGSHEVITTIMLNFVAAGICSWITVTSLKGSESQNPETDLVSANYMLHQIAFFDGAPVSTVVYGALACVLLVWLFLRKTILGYELRSVGQNEKAAYAAGIQPANMRILSMALAGGLAGLVGVAEVLGNTGRFKIDFSPGYGFIGIAVALVGRQSPVGIIFASLLFGALHKGTADLDLETEHVTRDLSQILQALVILCVSAEGLWSCLGQGVRKRAMTAQVSPPLAREPKI